MRRAISASRQILGTKKYHPQNAQDHISAPTFFLMKNSFSMNRKGIEWRFVMFLLSMMRIIFLERASAIHIICNFVAVDGELYSPSAAYETKWSQHIDDIVANKTSQTVKNGNYKEPLDVTDPDYDPFPSSGIELPPY